MTTERHFPTSFLASKARNIKKPEKQNVILGRKNKLMGICMPMRGIVPNDLLQPADKRLPRENTILSHYYLYHVKNLKFDG
jgi:hypothetical protein